MAADNSELRGRITEYGNFISRTLQPQLQTAVDAREETEAEISEYARLQTKLRRILSEQESITVGSGDRRSAAAPINTIVDIAHGAVYCNATIPNPRTIYVDVGFGFHIEMTLPEAMAFIDKRINYLDTEVLKHRSNVAATVAKDVENALEMLEEFGEELAELESSGR